MEVDEPRRPMRRRAMAFDGGGDDDDDDNTAPVCSVCCRRPADRSVRPDEYVPELADQLSLYHFCSWLCAEQGCYQLDGGQRADQQQAIHGRLRHLLR